jgi:hypothetical protein
MGIDVSRGFGSFFSGRRARIFPMASASDLGLSGFSLRCHSIALATASAQDRIFPSRYQTGV